MGCGFKKKPEEDHFIQEKGLIISSGPEGIRDPEKIDDREDYRVDFIGSALLVKEKYKPEYAFIPAHGGNHTFKVKPYHHTYEFLLASAWSEGAVYNNKEDFTAYIKKTQREYNHPLQVEFVNIQEKSLSYLSPVFDDVDVKKDIVFKEVVNQKGEREKLSLDGYTPIGQMDDFAVENARFLCPIL
jgi:hypothetical protein